MKLVMTSDTHTRHRKIRNLPEGDIFIHAGDFSNIGTLEPHILKDFNDWLGDLPYAHKIVICGNHELGFDSLPKQSVQDMLSNCIYLDQDSVTIDGVKFYGEPRTPRFFDWAFNVDSHLMGNIWAKVPKDTDVLIAHGPPYAHGDKVSPQRRAGCRSMAQFLEQSHVKLVICGHIHEDGGTRHQLIKKNGNVVDVYNAAALPALPHLSPMRSMMTCKVGHARI